MNQPKQKGFSIVELLIVIAIVGLLVLLISRLPNVISLNSDSRNSSIALEVANKKMDYIRKQTYANLANGSTQFSESSLNGLNQAVANYEIEDCPSTICTNNELAKLVKVEIQWSEPNGQQSVHLETIVAQGGVGQ